VRSSSLRISRTGAAVGPCRTRTRERARMRRRIPVDSNASGRARNRAPCPATPSEFLGTDRARFFQRDSIPACPKIPWDFGAERRVRAGLAAPPTSPRVRRTRGKKGLKQEKSRTYRPGPERGGGAPRGTSHKETATTETGIPQIATPHDRRSFAEHPQRVTSPRLGVRQLDES
jgi:hypothetical protein